MSEENNIFLCGGVLFFMVMKAVYPDGSSRDHRNGVKDEHKAPDVMSDLVYTFTGSRSFGSEKDTSNYRECKIEGTVNVPFNDGSIIYAYGDTVQQRYCEALERMCEFSKWHIHPAMKEWLVKGLLEVIEFDESIKESDSLYIVSDGSCMTKRDLRKQGYFELEPFIVGVLHFVLKYRCGMNSLGLSTLDYYGNKIPYKERVHKGNAGQRITREIAVNLYERKEDDSASQDVEVVREEIEEDIESTEEFVQDSNADKDEGFDFESAPEADTETEEKKITVIQHQTNVIQNGENNFNLTNNGVMNFDFGGGRK